MIPPFELYTAEVDILWFSIISYIFENLQATIYYSKNGRKLYCLSLDRLIMQYSYNYVVIAIETICSTEFTIK